MPHAADGDLARYFCLQQKIHEAEHLAAYTGTTSHGVSTLTDNCEFYHKAAKLANVDLQKAEVAVLFQSLSQRYDVDDEEELYQKGRTAAIDNQMAVLQDHIEIGCQYIRARKFDISKYAGNFLQVTLFIAHFACKS